MTASLDAMMLEVVRSYPAALRRSVEVATVTRTFSRDLMMVLAEDLELGDVDPLWDELVALPFVEHRSDEVSALHESARRPLLADLRQRDRALIATVARLAWAYFDTRIASAEDEWGADVLELIYYALLHAPGPAMEDIDKLVQGPAISGYPARRSALVAVVVELVDAELLTGQDARWGHTLQLEELVDSGRAERALELGVELGVEPDLVVETHIDARIANALGLAHAQLGRDEDALSLYRRVSGGTSWWSATALLREGDIYVRRRDHNAALAAYFASLRLVIAHQAFQITDAVARGSVRMGSVAAWNTPFDISLTYGDAEDPAEPSDASLIFLEGDPSAAPDALDLHELPDGRVGALVEPVVGFGLLWLRIADLYVGTGRLDEARSAAELASRIATAVGDHNVTSQAFDVLAGIGRQRGDRELLHDIVGADRELSAFVLQTGEPPERLRAGLRLGWSEATDGHLVRATDAFLAARAAAHELDDRIALASASLGLAEVARQDQRTDDAVAELENAMAEYTEAADFASVAEARHRLGDLLVEVRRPEQALAALEVTRRFYAERDDQLNEASARVSLAQAAAVAGDYAAADDHLERARELAALAGDDRVRVSVELSAGDLLVERFAFDRAIAVYRAALALAGSLHPDLRASCYLSLGGAEVNLDPRQAAEDYARAARLFGQLDDVANEIRATAQEAVALALLRDGSAVELAEELVNTLPSELDRGTSGEAFIALAAALQQLNRYGDALDVLSSPDVVELGINVAIARLEVLSAMGRFDEVLDGVDELLDGESYRADLHAMRGWCLLNAEPPRFAEAEVMCRRALDLEPDNPWHQKDLASCLLGTGKTAEGIAVAARVVERLTSAGLNGLGSDILTLAGFSAYLATDYPRAAELMAATVRLDPLDLVTDFDLALVKLCSGDPGAEEHYAKVADALSDVDAPRRHGILIVAVRDVQYAQRWDRVPDLAAAQRILDRLQTARDRLG